MYLLSDQINLSCHYLLVDQNDVDPPSSAIPIPRRKNEARVPRGQVVRVVCGALRAWCATVCRSGCRAAARRANESVTLRGENGSACAGGEG